jgi:ATP-dependent Clp protease ATP-binding subunit ClpC
MESVIFTSDRLKLSVTDVIDAMEELDLGKRSTSKAADLNTLSRLASKIKRRIIGQDAAIDAVVKSLIRSKLGLRTKKRPLGNFLFLGPTGVGKTELAKVLAEEFFGSGSVIRLDMTDFAEKHTVARLVGAPPGYVGYGEGGELTQKIETKPDSVVLFDEIEKAHPDVLNILLQIMEEGELSDAKGGIFDFSKSIIILTSNLGTEIVHNGGISFDEKVLENKNIEERLKSNLKKILKPELLNRFDEQVVFSRISKENQLEIIDLLVKEVEQTLLRQNVFLKVNQKAREILLKVGYSEEYGARSLRRTLERELLDKIAEILLVKKDRPLRIKTSVRNGVMSLV